LVYDFFGNLEPVLEEQDAIYSLDVCYLLQVEWKALAPRMATYCNYVIFNYNLEEKSTMCFFANRKKMHEC